MAKQSLADKALGMIRGRKPQIDKGLDKAQQTVSDKTGGKYDEKISSARDQADKVLNDEGAGSEAQGRPDAATNDRPGDDSGSSRR